MTLLSLFHAINWKQAVMYFFASLFIVLSVQTFFYLHNLFLFKELSMQWYSAKGTTFKDLEIHGYDFGDLLMYKFYAVGISNPAAILILVATLVSAKKIKDYWIAPLLVCLLIILIFPFSDYRFFYESILVWLAAKLVAGKALLLVITGFLELGGGILLFYKSRYFV
jgi:hypothetical protein